MKIIKKTTKNNKNIIILACNDKELKTLKSTILLRKKKIQLKKKKTCCIFGVDEANWFLKKKVPSDKVESLCVHIFDNPTKYCTAISFDGRYYDKKIDDYYYDFLKFLWVQYPSGEEKRLCDIVEDTYEK